MAVQIINDPGRAATFGQNFSQSLGSGLQALLQHKLGEKVKATQQQKTAKGLESLNFTPEEARALSLLPESYVKEIFKRGLPIGEIGAQQQTKSIQDSLNGLNPSINESNNETPTLQPKKTIRQTLSEPYESPEFKLRKEQGAEKIAQKDETTAIKLNEDAIKKYETEVQESPKRRAKFNRMEKLIDSGKVQFGLYGKGLLSLGRANKETQEVQKFIKDSIADYVKKGILTDTKAGILEDSMINLMQTKEGAQQVLYQLQQFNELENADAEAYKEVRKKNKNRIPRDLSLQVDSLAEARKEQIYKNIEAGLEGTVKAGAPVSSVPAAKRAYGQPATNPKTGQQLNWNGSEWIPREQWNLLNKGA